KRPAGDEESFFARRPAITPRADADDDAHVRRDRRPERDQLRADHERPIQVRYAAAQRTIVSAKTEKRHSSPPALPASAGRHSPAGAGTRIRIADGMASSVASQSSGERGTSRGITTRAAPGAPVHRSVMPTRAPLPPGSLSSAPAGITRGT